MCLLFKVHAIFKTAFSALVDLRPRGTKLLGPPREKRWAYNPNHAAAGNSFALAIAASSAAVARTLNSFTEVVASRIL